MKPNKGKIVMEHEQVDAEPVEVEAPQVENTSIVVFGKSNFVARPIKSVTIKTQFTRELIAMAHEVNLMAEMLSEVYVIQLPVKGRVETDHDASVVDVGNLETGAVATLICNATMVRSLADAAKQGPLKGRTFAFRSNDMVADQRYRMVEVCEIEVEHGEGTAA